MLEVELLECPLMLILLAQFRVLVFFYLLLVLQFISKLSGFLLVYLREVLFVGTLLRKLVQVSLLVFVLQAEIRYLSSQLHTVLPCLVL